MSRTIDRVWIQRIVVVVVWVTIVLLWRRYQSQSGLGTLETAQRFIDEVEAHWWGALAFIAAYLLRPLLLFPASVMTVAAGLVFGPVVGVLLVIVAANASAMVAYVVGRSIAGGPDDTATADDEQAGLVARWGRRLRERSFETVFIMRLLFLPYDLVNYVCGALRIRWTAFLAATALGTLPGTISFVLLGASLERIDEGLDGIDPWTVVASMAIFVVSLGIARITRRRTGASDTIDDTAVDTPTGPTAIPNGDRLG